jgi:lysozyme
VKISEKGLELIKQFEGLRLEAYLCSAGVATIGYGSTRGVKLGQTITEEEATEKLRVDVLSAEECVNDHVEVSLTQNQFDSLVSFVFNLGCGAFKGSTLLALLNAGKTDAAAAQFPRWNKAGGKVVQGLVWRRNVEREFFCA